MFLHDPLLDWQLSASKVAKTRKPRASSSRAATPPDDTDEEDVDEDAPGHNLDAAHAIRRVSVKLRGLDFQEGEPLSVEGTVEQLLRMAMDPIRLSHHFAGWSPWC